MLDGIRSVHFIGIGGYGMSALARILLEMGYEVTGSDLKPSRLTRSLEARGARIHIGHSRDHVTGAQLAVFSTAIRADNPELEACRDQGIPVWHRSDLLARFINNRFGIAVAGTHGKTTTTSMVSLILEEGGLDPTALVGGEVINFGGNARFGRSTYLVAEACESDNSFLRYHPTAAILTNIEADHLEFHNGSFQDLVKSYKVFVEHLKPLGILVYCADDQNVLAVSGGFAGEKVSYALDRSHVCYRGEGLRETRGCYSFRMVERGQDLGAVNLLVPGRHNVYNALGAAALSRSLGVGFEDIAKALSRFKGAKRRFQVLGKGRGVTVVDDYAHHPTEVKATLEAARGYSEGRVIAVFQPHRYSRLKYFMDDFARSFHHAQVVILHDVYAAGEEPMEGVTSAALGERVSRESRIPVHHLRTHPEIISFLEKNVKDKDTVLFMGAGDISGTAYEFHARITGGERG